MPGDKPAMPVGLQELAVEAQHRHGERFAPPALAVASAGDGWLFACPYRDEDRGLWEALLFRCFGTRSAGVVRVFLSQLSKLTGQEWNPEQGEWRPDLDELNAALAIIASTEPENESQAALAAQMVACHLTSMKLGGLMGSMTAPDERTAATLARVSKTYAQLARTLAELQGKVRGSRHDINVTYYDQRQQAVVMGGEQDIGGQPHGTGSTAYPGASASVPGHGQRHGEPLRIASREGQARVPGPRWGSRIWSALGLR